jgi:hypothetical protein
MWKRKDSTGDLVIADAKRSPYNLSNDYLLASTPDFEQTALGWDFTANGFKMRHTGGVNNGTIIYLAFAEFPFGGSGISQARAR